MKNYIQFSLLLFSLVFASTAAAQSSHSWLRLGDKAYENKDFSNAEDSYRRSLEKENSAQGTYNLGNSIYKQGRFGEAVKHYETAAESAKNKTAKAQAYHNLGNAYFNQKQYDKSAEAYKNSLRLNPNDIGTKQNLALAQQLLQKEPPPPDQQQQQNQQQQQDQQQQNQKNQQQQDQQQSQKSEKEQPQDLSKEEAAKLLEVMDQEEQKVQEKLRKGQSRPNKPKKDW